MTGVLGDNITLSCPGRSKDAVIDGVTSPVKEWFQGHDANPKSIVIQWMAKGVHVESNFTAEVHEKKWASSLDGNLSLQNLTLEDAGLYTCSFSGSHVHTIQLDVIKGMFNWHVYRYNIRIIQINERKQCFSFTRLMLGEFK